MTHPPLEKRLEALAEIAREMGRPVDPSAPHGAAERPLRQEAAAGPGARPALCADDRGGDARHASSGSSRPAPRVRRLQAALGRRLRPRRERPPAAARPRRRGLRARSSSAGRTSSATRGSSSATPISRIRSRRSTPSARGSRSRASARSCSPRSSGSRAASSPVFWIYSYKRGHLLAVRARRGRARSATTRRSSS